MSEFEPSQATLQAPLTGAVDLEFVEEVCDSVENVWRNKLVSLMYLALAAVVSYGLVVSFVMLEN